MPGEVAAILNKMILINVDSEGFKLPDSGIIEALSKKTKVTPINKPKQFIPNPWLFVLITDTSQQEKLYHVTSQKEWLLFSNPELPVDITWLVITNINLDAPQNLNLLYE